MNKQLLFAVSLVLATPLAAMAAPEVGDKSFTISGTGASDKHFDGNSFGVTGQLGYYQTENFEYGVRQSFNGLVGDEVDNAWSGATRLFADYHFGCCKMRPFVGANLGGIYGESVNDTGAAGLELGAKYWVLEKTFINVAAEYQWLFSGSSGIDDNFDDGAIYYTLGVGFNF